MGCTLSYWLAAMDERIKAVAHLCCFADLRKMIELGNHDGHGVYLIVPGPLERGRCRRHRRAGRTSARSSSASARPTSLTPPAAVALAWEETSAAYAAAPDRLQLVSEPGVKHQETPRMREAALAFFARYL
jgi:hypothetical protein